MLRPNGVRGGSASTLEAASPDTAVATLSVEALPGRNIYPTSWGPPPPPAASLGQLDVVVAAEEEDDLAYATSAGMRPRSALDLYEAQDAAVHSGAFPVPPPRYTSGSMNRNGQHVYVSHQQAPPPQPRIKSSSSSETTSRKKQSAVLINPAAVGLKSRRDFAPVNPSNVAGRKKARRTWTDRPQPVVTDHHGQLTLEDLVSSPEAPLLASTAEEMIPPPPAPPKQYYYRGRREHHAALAVEQARREAVFNVHRQPRQPAVRGGAGRGAKRRTAQVPAASNAARLRYAPEDSDV